MRETSANNNLAGSGITPGFPKEIGGIRVDNPVWLAPMAGVTYYSLRNFFKRLGAGLVHTEMVSALGLCYKGRKTKELLYGKDEVTPVALQLFGSNAEDIQKASELAFEIRNFSAVEINMACPMPKVTKRGAGSALLERQEEAVRIIKSLQENGYPVWAKIRRLKEDAETLKFCEALLNAGAKQIFLHGRTVSQRYEGRANREIVRQAAEDFPSMISASGDCYEAKDFEEYLGMGCQTVLAARGALKDLCLIPKALAALGARVDKKYSEPSAETKLELMIALCDAICGKEGESRALVMAHKVLPAVFKGERGAGEIKRKTAFLRSWAEIKEYLSNWKDVVEDTK